MDKQKKIDPLAIDLSEMFVVALNKHLMTTAFCLDLARKALGWELAKDQKQARRAVKKAFQNF